MLDIHCQAQNTARMHACMHLDMQHVSGSSNPMDEIMYGPFIELLKWDQPIVSPKVNLIYAASSKEFGLKTHHSKEREHKLSCPILTYRFECKDHVISS